MSAIVAVLHLDGRPVGREQVVKLTQTMASNGPDAQDVWVDGAVGLGCASFYTVPEQLDERSPLETGTRALVLDGRIDNRVELRRDCAGRGITVAQDAGDGAYVMAAYDAWGLNAPAHLVGEWAFVLWDKTEERLLGARDHMARRSLRWWSDGRTLLVSSQFPGILGHPDVRAEPNEGVVAEWLAGSPATIDETLWAGIRNVPGGRRLVSSRRGRPRVDRYWDPASEREPPINSTAEAADAYRATVADAIQARMRCIGTPEIELSGGWDSSTVALVASQLHVAGGADFRLCSTVFPDVPECDETPYIEAVERRLGRTSIKRAHVLAPCDALVDATRESRHPWRRDDWRTIRPSPAHRVTLTGEGGNETLGGMWRSAPSMLANALLTRAPDRPGPRTLLASIVRPHVRPSLPLAIRVLRSAPPSRWLDPDFGARTSVAHRVAAAEPTVRFTSLRRIRILAWLDSWDVQNSDLSAELDRGRYVETREPFHDVRLVRLALRVPARVMGARHTDARQLHRHIYGRFLPDLVTARTFGTGFRPLRALEFERLLNGLGQPRRLQSAGWIDAKRCGTLTVDALLREGSYRASLLYALEQWMTSESLQ